MNFSSILFSSEYGHGCQKQDVRRHGQKDRGCRPGLVAAKIVIGQLSIVNASDEAAEERLGLKMTPRLGFLLDQKGDEHKTRAKECSFTKTLG